MNHQDSPSAAKRGNLIAGCAYGLFVLFITEILVGMVLETKYSATPKSAYGDVSAMQAGMFAWIRGFHYWSSAILISGSAIVLIWMLFARWFNGGHNRMWLGTGLLGLSSLLFQISGNLLPFDRHGVQTAVIESGVARQMPIVGPISARLIVGGEAFNDGTIARWHIAHVGFFVLGLAAFGIFWTGSRTQPKNRVLIWAPVCLAVMASLIARAPLGMQATASDYGSYDAQVSWYTWPLHGSLNLFNRIHPGLGWIGSGVMPGLLVVFIIAAPWLGRRLRPRAIQGIFVGLSAYFVVAGTFFAGRFAPLTGNRDPAPLVTSQVATNSKVDPILFAKGRKVFNSNSCAGCHGVDGQHGSEGPDLLGVSTRRGTDPIWYMNFIKNPASVKPNTMMPPFPELPTSDTRAIAEFLIHQK